MIWVLETDKIGATTTHRFDGKSTILLRHKKRGQNTVTHPFIYVTVEGMAEMKNFRPLI